jgi:proline iminopeptidase
VLADIDLLRRQLNIEVAGAWRVLGSDPSARFRLCFARLVTHYWRHNGWLPDGVLLQRVNRLAGIPAVLMHGRLDICTPLIGPWQLAKRWPGSEQVIVGCAGHDFGMSESIVAATDRFAASE